MRRKKVIRKGNPFARWWSLLTPGAKKKIVAFVLGSISLICAVVIVVFLGLKGLGRSDFFQISLLKITGNHRVSKSEVIALSGLDIYSNLLSVDIDEVKRNIEAHEWIERVVLRKKWPNTLKLAIRERTPLAIMNTENGIYYVDKKGQVFVKIGPGYDLDYPVLSGMERMISIGPDGAATAEDSQKIQEALSLIRNASNGSSSFPRQNISQIFLDPKGNFILFLTDRPFPIYLGEEITQEKFLRLKKVLYWLYKKRDIANIGYIRLDYQQNKVLVSKNNS